jgi:sugar O-acyltransferase (sialic acid O-acetyltransferase NeuD family)
MKNKLIIIGAGGHGRVIADIAIKTNMWEGIYFLDDDESITQAMGIKVIGKASDWDQYKDRHSVFVAMGDNDTRKKWQERLAAADADIPTLIHPSAVIGHGVEIGAGTAVMAGVAVNCGSVIGKGCIINTGTTIDHDNAIGDYVHLSPGVHLAGTVTVGKGTWLGTGSVVINNISIAGNCVIGAGTVVISDIKESGTFVGVPARRIK